MAFVCRTSHRLSKYRHFARPVRCMTTDSTEVVQQKDAVPQKATTGAEEPVKTGIAFFVQSVQEISSPPKPEDVKPAVVEKDKFHDTEITHTGQVFGDDDIRIARFSQGRKLVNKQWAVKLIDEIPPIPKEDRIVSCDGGGGPLGHPIVFINLDQEGNHTCGYCGLRFYKEDHEH